MKGKIIFSPRKGGNLTFKITNEQVWKYIYSDVAFLAESGHGVSYMSLNGGEE